MIALDFAELLLQLGAGGILVTAGALKGFHARRFVQNVAQLRVLPDRWARIAIVIPFVELVLGLAIIARIAPLTTGLGLSVLGASFFAVLVIAMARGADTHCGCFGVGTTPVSLSSAYRASGLFAAGASLSLLAL